MGRAINWKSLGGHLSLGGFLQIYLESDVAWVNDGMRVHGDQFIREENNCKLKQMFDEAGVDYVIVKGNYEERFERCKALVKAIMK